MWKENCKNLNSNGITLIALVVTIIVLLILAGVTIATLTGDNGILNQAQNSKKRSDIAFEKEQIALAINSVHADKYNTEILDTDIENELKANGNNVEVLKFGSNFVIKFIDTNRSYELYENSEVSEPQEKNNDPYAGDITKGKTLDGSQGKPYEISCIEDLVSFSIATNGGNTELGISSNNYNGKYILLTKTLDFNSYFSYNNYETTKYGDLNTQGGIENLYLELTRRDEGCVGFNPIGTFGGKFDGNGNEIKNIYENNSGNACLFTSVSNATISNLVISGELTGQNCGGIAVSVVANSKISNCINYCNIKGNTSAGGIAAYSCNTTYFENCINYGSVSGSQYSGGIIGLCRYANQTTNIKQCFNIGEIYSESGAAGGIYGSASGYSGNQYQYVENCYNIGDIKGFTYVGGITGFHYGGSLLNCYNSGNVELLDSKGKNGGLFARRDAMPKIENCYYVQGNYNVTIDGTVECLEEDMRNGVLLDELNKYVEQKEGWAYWAVGTYGYPTLDYDKISDGIIDDTD